MKRGTRTGEVNRDVRNRSFRGLQNDRDQKVMRLAHKVNVHKLTPPPGGGASSQERNFVGVALSVVWFSHLLPRIVGSDARFSDLFRRKVNVELLKDERHVILNPHGGRIEHNNPIVEWRLNLQREADAGEGNRGISNRNLRLMQKSRNRTVRFRTGKTETRTHSHFRTEAKAI